MSFSNTIFSICLCEKKCLFSVKYDSFTDIQTLVGILKAIILEYITSYIL